MLEDYQNNKYYNSDEEESVQPWSTFESGQLFTIRTPLAVSKLQNVRQSIEGSKKIIMKQTHRSPKANKSISNLPISKNYSCHANTSQSKHMSLLPKIQKELKENLEQKYRKNNFSLHNDTKIGKYSKMPIQIVIPKNNKINKAFLQKIHRTKQQMDSSRYPIHVSILQPKFRQNSIDNDIKNDRDSLECKKIQNIKKIKSSFSQALYLKKQYSSFFTHSIYGKRHKKSDKKSFLIQKIMLNRKQLSPSNLAVILQQNEWKQNKEQMISLINRQKVKQRQLQP